MQTRALKTLSEIAKVGSFVTAAQHLNMTLSALSMQMKSLEKELGVALFDRSFRPPKLTPLGRSICEHAASVLTAEDALKAACDPNDQLTGRYRLGFVMTASVRLLPDFLISARQHAPHASFGVATGLSETLEAQLVNGDLDGAIVTASTKPDPRLSYHLICEESLAFAVPEEYRGLSPDRLNEQLQFLQFLPDSGIGKLITKYVEPIISRRKRVLVIDSVEAIMECVKNGIGFTLLPEPDIRRYADNRIAVIKSQRNEISRQLVLATLRNASTNRQTELLSELFIN